MVVLLIAAAVWAQAIVARMPWASGAQGFSGETREGDLGAEQLAARWAAEYAGLDLSARTPIHLGYSHAFSKHYTEASGTVLNFDTGHVTVAVNDRGPLPADATIARTSSRSTGIRFRTSTSSSTKCDG
jgi:hypothetical protein